jgi:hypothetical protein
LLTRVATKNGSTAPGRTDAQGRDPPGGSQRTLQDSRPYPPGWESPQCRGVGTRPVSRRPSFQIRRRARRAQHRRHQQARWKRRTVIAPPVGQAAPLRADGERRRLPLAQGIDANARRGLRLPAACAVRYGVPLRAGSRCLPRLTAAFALSPPEGQKPVPLATDAKHTHLTRLDQGDRVWQPRNFHSGLYLGLGLAPAHATLSRSERP